MFTRLVSSSKAAIDLASIMVGVIVLSLIGGVIGATVFVVIPWVQDEAAKGSLRAVATAQAAYAGFQASEQSGTGSLINATSIPVRTAVEGLYADYNTLVAEGYLESSTETSVCSEPEDNAAHWTASVISASGNSFYLSDTLPEPTQVADGQITCFGLWQSPNKEYITPPAPTTMTLNCDVETTALLPFQNFTGAYQWSDGQLGTVTASTIPTRTLNAGTQYTITLYGTFTTMTYLDVATQSCITSMDAWNPEAGVTNLTDAFRGATKLTSVAAPPTTVTNMSFMFYGATNFNQNISTWNTSNVTNFRSMFQNATNFNQPIGTWDTSKATSLREMFYGADSFNQPLGTWNTALVQNMSGMFRSATQFNQDLSAWNTSRVTAMNQMFYSARNFNGNISTWNTSLVTTMQTMFAGAGSTTSTSFNQNISNWDVSRVTNMSGMFQYSYNFNQNISSWNTGNVTTMANMFSRATSFNQNISGWNVNKVTAWSGFRSSSGLSTANTPSKFL